LDLCSGFAPGLVVASPGALFYVALRPPRLFILFGAGSSSEVRGRLKPPVALAKERNANARSKVAPLRALADGFRPSNPREIWLPGLLSGVFLCRKVQHVTQERHKNAKKISL